MAEPACITRIKANANRDGIDLTVLPFYQDALKDIASISAPLPSPVPDFTNATRIDTHVHPVPYWFRSLNPLAAGRETPAWNISAHLSFMSEYSIKRSILCISTPQANPFPGDKQKTIALARILNEFSAELVRVWPERFSWLAITTLPYVEESVREVKYALDDLGAVGVGVLTNHEALYPGDESFDPLWSYINTRATREGGDGREIVFIHPTDPSIRLDNGTLVNSKPCKFVILKTVARKHRRETLIGATAPLRSGLAEFYFETARALATITASRTIHKFPNIHWRASHGAGAFPDIEDRFLVGYPEDRAESERAYRERFWYDSAGPVYPRQIRGLLAHGIPTSQFLFGTVSGTLITHESLLWSSIQGMHVHIMRVLCEGCSYVVCLEYACTDRRKDYPYGIGFWNVSDNIAGLTDADFLSAEEKESIFYRNAQELWKGKIPGL
jgi:hypothetical protein